MAGLRSAGAPWPAAVGVSSGGDSVALMVLLAEWAQRKSLPPPFVVTVDHGLRSDSGEDTKRAYAFARSLGVEAEIIRISGTRPRSDVEAWARTARYTAIAAVCRERGLNALYVGHHQDDQAETFLLRLARGSGVDGLSAMQPLSAWPIMGYSHLRLARPLLNISRSELHDFLRERGIGWRDDLMNADTRFARVRLREAWPAFEAAGLSAWRVAAAARHLHRAREALDTVVDVYFSRAVQTADGQVLADGAALAELPRELGLRALAKLLIQVSAAPYRPRFERLEGLYNALLTDGLRKARTLHGCRIKRAAKRDAVFGEETLLVEREPPRRQR